MRFFILILTFCLPAISIAQTSIVMGTITSKEGKPIEGAEVYFSENESGNTSSQPAKTNGNGVFTLHVNRNLPFKYWISVKKNGYDFTRIRLTVKSGNSLRLEMAFTAGFALYTLDQAKIILDKLNPPKVIYIQSKPIIEDNNEDVLRLSSEIEGLKQSIVKGRIATSDAETKSDNLLNRVKSLEKNN